MIIEVIAVGTELLIGQIVNSNAAVIGSRLAEDGFDAHYQVTVGDNLARLVAAIEVALARSDAVLITGGIGPTRDDLTREALCQVGGRVMVREHAHAAWIKDRLRPGGGEVNPTVLRMADLPEGSLPLANPNGVALGVAMEVEGKWIFAVPGVPAEMRAMLDEEVLPRLRGLGGESNVLRSRVLRTWGLGESRIAEALDDLFESTNPSVAFLVSDMEVKVRITAKAANEKAAEAAIGPVEAEIRERLGDLVFGADEETVERLVVDRLAGSGWSLGTVERATMGQVGVRIAGAERGAEVFGGTVVPGGSCAGPPPSTDVLVEVGPIGADPEPGRRTTRQVAMTVTTPLTQVSRSFDFGGDDERLRSFATIAALHLLRVALEGDTGR